MPNFIGLESGYGHLRSLGYDLMIQIYEKETNLVHYKICFSAVGTLCSCLRILIEFFCAHEIKKVNMFFKDYLISSENSG